MNPHLETVCEERGAPLGEASCTAVLVHGRGHSAAAMDELVDRLDRPGVAYLLPNADGGSWYPESFLVPRERNEPRLGHALEALDVLRSRALGAGVSDGAIVWVGFSQGACLVLDYVARHPAPFGGVVALTGGLIGASHEHLGGGLALAGLPVVVATSDVDEFVPLARVEASVDYLTKQGAVVELHVFQQMGHEICDDEVDLVRQVLDRVAAAAPRP